MRTPVCRDLADFGLRLITAEDPHFSALVAGIQGRTWGPPVPDTPPDRAAVLLNEGEKTVYAR